MGQLFAIFIIYRTHQPTDDHLFPPHTPFEGSIQSSSTLLYDLLMWVCLRDSECLRSSGYLLQLRCELNTLSRMWPTFCTWSLRTRSFISSHHRELGVSDIIRRTRSSTVYTFVLPRLFRPFLASRLMSLLYSVVCSKDMVLRARPYLDSATKLRWMSGLGICVLNSQSSLSSLWIWSWWGGTESISNRYLLLFRLGESPLSSQLLQVLPEMGSGGGWVLVSTMGRLRYSRKRLVRWSFSRVFTCRSYSLSISADISLTAESALSSCPWVQRW